MSSTSKIELHDLRKRRVRADLRVGLTGTSRCKLCDRGRHGALIRVEGGRLRIGFVLAAFLVPFGDGDCAVLLIFGLNYSRQ